MRILTGSGVSVTVRFLPLQGGELTPLTAQEDEDMAIVTITLELPEGATFNVATRASPPRLALPRRRSPGLPVKTFVAAFESESEDGKTANAEAVRDRFAVIYPVKSDDPETRKDTLRKALRRALDALTEEFVIERRGGVEWLRRLDEPRSPEPQSPPGSGNPGAIVPSISATRGARTPRSGGRG